MPRPTRLARRAAGVLLLATGLGGCDLFDKSLLGGEVAELCGGDAPVQAANTSIMVDTTTMRDDLNAEVAGCIGQGSPGNDGFFAVEMQEGEKWHFHVRNNSGSGVNPSIYILNSTCDDRTCQAGDAIDVCTVDRDEHLSFVADRTGLFYVGIDSRDVGGGIFNVELWRPECGNGTLEHSEGCDDPADTTCDSECRHIIGSGESEQEPNDDFTSANTTLTGAGSMTMNAQLVDLCDLDMSAMDLPANTTLTAVVLDRSGVACGTSAPEIELELLDSTGVNVIGAGSTGGAGGECPSIEGAAFATGLSGRYYLRVTTTQESALFNYQLSLTASSS